MTKQIKKINVQKFIKNLFQQLYNNISIYIWNDEIVK